VTSASDVELGCSATDDHTAAALTHTLDEATLRLHAGELRLSGRSHPTIVLLG